MTVGRGANPQGDDGTVGGDGRRYALVAGGGTAGHLRPALAIAEALVDLGHDKATIEFVGSERGQDAATLDGLGFPVTLLPGRGIVRSMALRDLARNFRSMAELLEAVVRAVSVVGRARPRVVVAVGGYASLAGAVGAVLHRVPLVLLNVDAVPGATNRLLGRFAKASAVGWEGNSLPRAVVTGTPVRPAISSLVRSPAARDAARAELGVASNRQMVVVFGGSLGARQINRAVDGLAVRWDGRGDRSIYHIVGRRDWGDYSADATVERIDCSGAVPDGIELIRVPYEERMASVYAAADLMVCRAGAMTVAELAAAGVPSVLVPLPGAPGDHQTANARVLEMVGAAVLLPDAACTPTGLADVVEELLAHPDRLEAMGRSAKGVARPDAARAGARLVEANALSGGTS